MPFAPVALEGGFEAVPDLGPAAGVPPGRDPARLPDRAHLPHRDHPEQDQALARERLAGVLDAGGDGGLDDEAAGVGGVALAESLPEVLPVSGLRTPAPLGEVVPVAHDLTSRSVVSNRIVSNRFCCC